MSDREVKEVAELNMEEYLEVRIELEQQIAYKDGMIDKLEVRVKELEHQIAYKDGMIDGLKFAIRCDGISGGEVR